MISVPRPRHLGISSPDVQGSDAGVVHGLTAYMLQAPIGQGVTFCGARTPVDSHQRLMNFKGRKNMFSSNS